MRITDGNGCSTNSPISNVFCSVGLDEYSDEFPFRIYPNPTNGKFFLDIAQVTSHPISKIEIYNIMGERVFRTYPHAGQFSIFNDLSSQADGIYFVEISGENISHMKIELNHK